MSLDVFKAFVLGVVEGLTEFLPVSSTGHLLLLERFFGFDDDQFGKTFVVLIQLGAILAILSIYFLRLWKIALGFFTDPAARRFVIGVLIAFLPAAVIGALGAWLHQGRVVQRLGGLLHADRRRRDPAVDRFARPQAALSRRHAIPAGTYFIIGLAQCLAMIPGVSRVGHDHRVRHAARRRQALGGRVLVLPRDPDHGRRLRLRSLQEPFADDAPTTSRWSRSASSTSFVVAFFVVKTLLDYVTAPRLRAVRVVARPGRLAGTDRARGGLLSTGRIL